MNAELMYINCHTYYSLRYGTMSPKVLVNSAKERGIKQLALTDINNSSCAFEFIQLCQKAEIKPIIGIEFRSKDQLQFIGIAKNIKGYAELNAHLSKTSLEEREIYQQAPKFQHAYVIYPRLFKPIERFLAHEYLGVRPEHLNRLSQSPLARKQDKLVAWCPVNFLKKEDHSLHKVLRAIDQNCLITKLDHRSCGKLNTFFHHPRVLEKLYGLFPQLLRNAVHLLDSCQVHMPEGLHNNKQHFTSNKSGDWALIRKLALKGWEQRYGTENRMALSRIEKELEVIRTQDFCAYFLITWDILRYAKSMGYQHVGRGSGANSIVAYCMFITDVDPLELDLYFERFINPHRSSPPDFDIDFSWDERDDVIDYIFKRYGEQHTALLATYNTFKFRSAARELGKVYGMPKQEIDQMIYNWSEEETDQNLKAQIKSWARKMEGMPNYLSIHAGGILISQKSIFYHSALKKMPKGFPIVHFDMHHAEDLGFHKFDILSQRGLGHIKDSIKYIEQNQNIRVNIHQIERFKKDPKVRSLLKSAHCMGCFYIESPAMRGLLSKLQCDNYLHLVAASSIIRPGVAKSGMMREYIRRFHNPGDIDFIHPVFEEQLGETFGLMVYQEDVMKIVHHFADFDLDESDVLRRIMSGKKDRNDSFSKLRHQYFHNCAQKGHCPEKSKEVWRQIESFSGYSFCKAHSASYAVESFQSLYLRAYFPLEFMLAVINNFGGFYKTEYYFHELRMLGAKIHAPCVNHSQYLSSISKKEVYIGFIHLHQLEKNTAQKIVEARIDGGAFKSFNDFLQRVQIGSEQVDLLIRIGAFRFSGLQKGELMWEKNAWMNPLNKDSSHPALFTPTIPDYTLPQLEESPYEQYFDEIELLGFCLQSPFDLVKQNLASGIRAQHLGQHIGRIVHIYGYYVCKKDVRTSNKKTMMFVNWIDREGHFFDTTHFPNSLSKQKLQGKGIYRIEGKVVSDFGFPSIEVLRSEKLAFRKDERY